jgi:hypothetical protein
MILISVHTDTYILVLQEMYSSQSDKLLVLLINLHRYNQPQQHLMAFVDH